MSTSNTSKLSNSPPENRQHPTAFVFKPTNVEGTIVPPSPPPPPPSEGGSFVLEVVDDTVLV
jgi:hypothetical protein